MIETVGSGFFYITDTTVQYICLGQIKLLKAYKYTNINKLDPVAKKDFYNSKKKLEFIQKDRQVEYLKLLRNKMYLIKNENYDHEEYMMEENYRIIRDLIKDGYDIKFIRADDYNAMMIVMVSKSEIIQYHTEKQLTRIKEILLSNGYTAELYTEIQNINKIIMETSNGYTFKFNHKHPQMEIVSSYLIQRIFSRLIKELPSNSRLPISGEGGYNFSISGDDYNMQEPKLNKSARQAIQGSTEQLRTWLDRHLRNSSYARMIVVGGICPDGFEKVDLIKLRLGLFKNINKNISNKGSWLPIIKIMETAYYMNNFTNNFVDLIIGYIQDSAPEDIENLDIESFYEMIPEMGREDYILDTVIKTLTLYNHREILSKGEQDELPYRIWIPYHGTREDMIIDLVALIKYLEDVDFLMIQDETLSGYMVSKRIKKDLDELLRDITTIYATNSMFIDHFKKIDKLILKHNRTSRYFIEINTSKSREDNNLEKLLFIPPLFMNGKNIYWIDPIEDHQINFNQLSPVFFNEHPQYKIISEAKNIVVEEVNKKNKVDLNSIDIVDYDVIEEDIEDEYNPYAIGVKIKKVSDKLLIDPEKIDNKKNDIEFNTDIDSIDDKKIDEDANETAFEAEEDETPDPTEILESYISDFGIRKYVNSVDAADRLDVIMVIETLDKTHRYFTIIDTIVYSYVDYLDLNKFDDKEAINLMINDGLLQKEVIDDNTVNIMLHKRGKLMFEKAMRIIKNLRNEIRDKIPVYLENQTEMNKELRKQGPNTAFISNISQFSLLATAYLSKEKRIPPLLLAFIYYMRDIYLINPEEFVSHSDATYMKELTEINKFVMSEKEIEEENKSETIPLVNQDIKTDMDEEFNLKPIIRDTKFVPIQKPKKKDKPTISADLGEMINDIPIKKIQRSISKKAEKKEEELKKEIIDKINEKKLLKKLMKRYDLNTVMTNSDNIQIGDKIIIQKTNSEMEFEAKINSLSIHHTNLPLKTKKILISYGITSIEDLLALDIHDIPEFNHIQRERLKLYIKEVKSKIRDNIGFDKILNKDGQDFFIRIGGYIELENLPKNVIFELPEHIKDSIQQQIVFSKNIEELMENAYNCIGKMIDETDHAKIDIKLSILQKRNHPMLFVENELKEFSISWLFSTVERGGELADTMEILLRDIAAIHINNKMIDINIENEIHPDDIALLGLIDSSENSE